MENRRIRKNGDGEQEDRKEIEMGGMGNRGEEGTERDRE